MCVVIGMGMGWGWGQDAPTERSEETADASSTKAKKHPRREVGTWGVRVLGVRVWGQGVGLREEMHTMG